MPEHELSLEARWLAENYRTLRDHRGMDLDGQWIAVIGEEIVDHDADSVALALRVRERYGEGVALFASVISAPLG